MNLSLIDLDGPGMPTAGAIAFRGVFGCHFTSPTRLNHAAQSLANFVSRYFNLVEMRRPRALFDSLDLAGNVSRLLEDFCQFFLEFCLFRVHAILPEL